MKAPNTYCSDDAKPRRLIFDVRFIGCKISKCGSYGGGGIRGYKTYHTGFHRISSGRRVAGKAMWRCLDFSPGFRCTLFRLRRYTPIGIGRDRRAVEKLRDPRIIPPPEGPGRASRGAYKPPPPV